MTTSAPRLTTAADTKEAAGTTPFPVNLIYLRMAHFGKHSGYEGVAPFLDATATTLPLQRWPKNRLASVANVLCAKVAGAPWYTFASMRLEAAALGRMATQSQGLFHMLYADSDARFLPLFNGLRGNQLIASIHQPPEELQQGMAPATLRRFSALLPVASSQVDYLTSMAGADRVLPVPYCVDTDFFYPAPAPPADPPVVLSVGTHLRDFRTLAQAAQLVVQKTPAVRFVVVAAPAQHHWFSELPYVRTVSSLSDDALLGLYHNSTVAALSLRDCTANNALLEAMACGLPAVVTEVGGVRDYADESCAKLVGAQDPKAFAEAILTLLDDSGSRATLGAAARAKAQTFHFPEIARKLDEVYRHVYTNL